MGANVAVVGRGFGASVHAPGWELVGANVLGVAGRGDWAPLVEAADVVSIATPPAERRELVLAAVSVGARVLAEKPLATSAAEAEELERAAAGVDTAVNFSYRALPAFRRLRELVDGEDLHVRWTTGSRLRAGPPGWRDDPAQGGALSAYGVHALDYARWLLGPARVEHAELAPNEDAFSAVLAHESGPRTHLVVSLVSDERIHRIETGDLVLENTDASDPVGAFTLRRRGVDVEVPAPRFRLAEGVDRRVAPFAVHAAALLAGDERPTFTDGVHAQRLLDEVRRGAS